MTGWVLADINVGVLYLFAISSLGVYGIIMAGWASNSKYAFLGALAIGRADGVLRGLHRFRHHHGAAVCRLAEPDRCRAWRSRVEGSGCWYFLPLLPMFIIFFISALAETNRRRSICRKRKPSWSPGYNVEYSSMAFALFFLGEYANMILMSGMTVVLFLGWLAAAADFAPFTWIPGVIWFALKIALCLFVFLWVRATFPRYRYDQLMRLGWKVFLPLSLLWVVLRPVPGRIRLAAERRARDFRRGRMAFIGSIRTRVFCSPN